jgi:WD40 repeat protein
LFQFITGDVKSIAFAPSHGQWGEGEEILLSASYDNSIKVWAEESGDWYCAATLGSTVHTSTIWSLGIAPSGVRFLSGSDDGVIAIWKMYTSSERKQQFPREQVMTSTDGLWNCVGLLSEAHSGYAVLSIDCAPSRAGHGRIVSGGGDNSIHVYREESGSSDAPKFAMDALASYAHDGDVNCVRWHPRNGGCLVSCGDDGAVKMWKYVQG